MLPSSPLDLFLRRELVDHDLVNVDFVHVDAGQEQEITALVVAAFVNGSVVLGLGPHGLVML